MKDLIVKESIKVIFTVVSLFFLLGSILSNFEELSHQSLDLVGWIYLFSSIFITCFSIVINGFAWNFFVNWLGFRPNKINLTAIYIKTNILKYLPGGIWHLVARVKELHPKINLSNSLLAVFLEPFLMLVSASLWVVLGNFNFLTKVLFVTPMIIFSDFFRVKLIKLLNVLIFNKFKNNNKLNFRDFSNGDLKILSKSYPVKPLLIEMGFIWLRFYGFWLCLKAFSPTSNLQFFDLIAFFSLAWIAGLIVPAAPGGVGVFESILLLLIGSNIAEAPLLASLLSYRVVSTFSDILTFVLISLNKPILFFIVKNRN